jgi:AraC-like DNA-binding protein
LAALFPGPVRFNARQTRLVFARELMDLPLRQADATALRLAQEQCERELDRLTSDDVSRVRRALAKPSGGFRSAEEVADTLDLSLRTLKRRLAARDTQFSTLLAEARSQRAVELLRDTELSVDAIAIDLGYSDTANFTRAFRRWHGRTPSEFRKRSM